MQSSLPSPDAGPDLSGYFLSFVLSAGCIQTYLHLARSLSAAFFRDPPRVSRSPLSFFLSSLSLSLRLSLSVARFSLSLGRLGVVVILEPDRAARGGV